MSHHRTSILHSRRARGTLRRPVPHSVDPEVRATFRSDAAHFPGGFTPAVYFPESEADVAAVLRENRTVLCVGAQSSLTGGATPRGEVLLSTARLAAIRSVARDRVVVGPGATLRALADELAATGRTYPPAPTYDGATIGGTVATNAAGAATFKYGSTRDWIQSITVVLASGEVLDIERGATCADASGCFTIVPTQGAPLAFRRPDIHLPDVAKVSCGYASWPGMDLIDLFIGSEGTLGVVTEIELRVLAPAPPVALAWVPLDSEAAALALTADLRAAAHTAWQDSRRAGIDISAIEYLDARSLALTEEDGVPGRVGLPACARVGAALLVQVELAAGTDRTAALAEIEAAATESGDSGWGSLTRFCRLVQHHGVLAEARIALPGDTELHAALASIREAAPDAVNRRIGALQRVHGTAISKAAADIVVPFAALSAALTDVRSIAAAHDLDVVVWGHVSDGNVHPNLLPSDAAAATRARAALLEIGRMAMRRGGAPMSEHGVGRNPVKQQLLGEFAGAAGLASMWAIKRTLDPGGMLAPGVLLPQIRS